MSDAREFIDGMRGKDPRDLERDRAEAWGGQAIVTELRVENARLRKVIAHLMTNPLDQWTATYMTEDIDDQTAQVEITDHDDGRTTIRVLIATEKQGDRP